MLLCLQTLLDGPGPKVSFLRCDVFTPPLIHFDIRIETKHVAYSCLAKMMREGGLGIIILGDLRRSEVLCLLLTLGLLAVRFSAVPGHVTTAIQSTVGLSVWIYGAYLLPLPGPIIAVVDDHCLLSDCSGGLPSEAVSPALQQSCIELTLTVQIRASVSRSGIWLCWPDTR